MAIENTLQALLVATTPSLGVRLRIEPNEAKTADMVCLHMGNEGGRGTPRYLVLLPVSRTAAGQVTALVAPSELRTSRRDDPDGLWQRHLRSPTETLPTPFAERYSGAAWAALCHDQPCVLVLVLFANPKSAQPADSKYADGEIIDALEAFFAVPQREHLLRRGLVFLAAADRPVPAADPAPGQAPLMTAREPKPALPPEATAFTFALASCQYPAGLVDGTPQAYGDGSQTGTMPPGPADASMLRLAARLDGPDDHHRPSLLVLTGDQIYADATAGLFDPRAGRVPALRSGIRDAEDWLRVPYQNWYGSVGAQAVLGRLVNLTMLDDHEIDNNWEPVAAPARPGTAERLQRLLEAGSQAYQRYQRDLRESVLLTYLWHSRLHRGIAFFMADTRTERDARHALADPCRPCIMSAHQTTELLAWIEADAPEALARPAFIVSPAMLLPRRRSSLRSSPRSSPGSLPSLRSALHSDAWDGYPGSLHHLLVQLWRIGRSNLVFLSGDEHLSCVVKVTVTKVGGPDRAITLHSVHSSGLYSPYPFANAVPALFALPDVWTFEDPHAAGQHYHCVVEPCSLDERGTPWAPGDGFALLSLLPPAAIESESASASESMAGATAAAPWQLEVRFDRAAPWAERRAQAPAPGVTTASCRLTLTPGPGRYQPPSA